MISLTAGTSSPTAIAETDPYIGLTVRWSVQQCAEALNLYVRDPEQGYVEFSIDSETGELRRFVVIDEPARVERRIDTQSIPSMGDMPKCSAVLPAGVRESAI